MSGTAPTIHGFPPQHLKFESSYSSGTPKRPLSRERRRFSSNQPGRGRRRSAKRRSRSRGHLWSIGTPSRTRTETPDQGGSQGNRGVMTSGADSSASAKAAKELRAFGARRSRRNRRSSRRPAGSIWRQIRRGSPVGRSTTRPALFRTLRCWLTAGARHWQPPGDLHNGLGPLAEAPEDKAPGAIPEGVQNRVHALLFKEDLSDRAGQDGLSSAV